MYRKKINRVMEEGGSDTVNNWWISGMSFRMVWSVSQTNDIQ